MSSPEWYLNRAYERLAAARHLRNGGFNADAFSRLYYAAFEAARAALAAMDVAPPRRHRGVRYKFHEYAVRGQRVPESLGKILDRLEAPRLAADYSGLSSEDYDLEKMERDTEDFVQAVRQTFSPNFKPFASVARGGKKPNRKTPAP